MPELTHAVLGAGGVGGLVGASLARAGREVTLIVRSADHPRTIHVESQTLGTFAAEVQIDVRLQREVDFLWIAVKGTQLDAALPSAPAELVRRSAIPLLNGIDHVGVLQRVYPRVTTGVIGVETERVSPGHIVQPQGFLWVQLAGPDADAVCDELSAAGLSCAVKPDANSILWQKLIMLAPLALTTTARQGPLGTLRHDPDWERRLMAAVDEAAAVARAEGAEVDPESTKRALSVAPESFRTSMQKDREAGRPLELDHIAGPVIRGGRRHEIPTPVFDELYAMLEPVAR